MWVSNSATGRNQVRWGSSPTSLNNTAREAFYVRWTAVPLCAYGAVWL